MTHIKTLGIDLGKTSFHVIGWDEHAQQVKRDQWGHQTGPMGSGLALCNVRKVD
ncbi:hypothetical protein NI389_05685 [Pseudoalteromonas xiamenensis]|uniref:hypothetical protein n=1 Tax=Pseudoalteromonas xiamenensis TaxID=882626 RepID=UPI0027E4BFA3|nr:hypothetical protein [Pseudoalteromonas xiamenensis]WMN60899.1 hypothetical protein NI389_05685 [Pseudoalteromonas xiamenensis]